MLQVDGDCVSRAILERIGVDLKTFDSMCFLCRPSPPLPPPAPPQPPYPPAPPPAPPAPPPPPLSPPVKPVVLQQGGAGVVPVLRSPQQTRDALMNGVPYVR
eukprot:3054564-Pleurochrysis_carterae.AAC.1